MMFTEKTYSRLIAKTKLGSQEDPCLEFQGSINSKGYGHIKVDNKTHRAHRVMFEYHKGPIPSGLFVRHRCNNRRCVRLEHLELGTVVDNYEDAKLAGTTRRPAIRCLTNEQAKEIKEMLKQGIKPAALVRKFRVGFSTIEHIQKGESYQEA